MSKEYTFDRTSICLPRTKTINKTRTPINKTYRLEHLWWKRKGSLGNMTRVENHLITVLKFYGPCIKMILELNAKPKSYGDFNQMKWLVFNYSLFLLVIEAICRMGNFIRWTHFWNSQEKYLIAILDLRFTSLHQFEFSSRSDKSWRYWGLNP